MKLKVQTFVAEYKVHEKTAQNLLAMKKRDESNASKKSKAVSSTDGGNVNSN